MDRCLITFRSVTPAQRAQGLLHRQAIACSLRRTPQSLAEQGCGYSLHLDREALPRGLEQLRRAGIRFQKVYCLKSKGELEELSL